MLAYTAQLFMFTHPLTQFTSNDASDGYVGGGFEG